MSSDENLASANTPPPAGLSGFGLSDWLCLAAAPTFAIMALLTAAYGSQDMMCMSGPGASMLSGMVPMYLLMAAFHLAPWLRLANRRARFDVAASNRPRAILSP